VYIIEGFADDLVWVCVRLGLENPVVVGHSLGGEICLELAASCPELPSLCPNLVIGKTVGSEHFIQLEVPEQVNAMIERFLAVALRDRSVASS
jgi:hypothetical protein